MSPSLPAEFCLEIASQVSDSRALHALSLTSRKFYHAAQPLLYEDIVINAFPTFLPVKQLHRTLTKTNPSLAGFVKSFTIDLTSHNLFILDYLNVTTLNRILAQLPRLSHFSMLPCGKLGSMIDLTFFTRPRPSVALKTLCLPLFIHNTNGFSEFLRRQPALEYLQIWGTFNGSPRVGRDDLPRLRVLDGPINAVLPLLRPSVSHLKLFIDSHYMPRPDSLNPPLDSVSGVKVLHVTATDIFHAVCYSILFLNVESITWELSSMYGVTVHYRHILSLFPKLRYLRLVSSRPWLENLSSFPNQISSPSFKCLEICQDSVAYRWYYPSIDYAPIRVRWTCRDGEEWLHDWNSRVERLTSGE